MEKAENEVEEVIEVPEGEEVVAEEQEKPEGETPEGEAEDGVIVSIGEESPASEDEQQTEAPEWVKDLRKKNREKDKRIRELEDRLNQSEPTKQTTTLGPEPTLEGCDYDTDKFKQDWKAWTARKAEQDAEESRRKEAVKQEQQAWQSRLDTYGKLKGELKVKDFEDAEHAATEVLNPTQQGIVVSGAENPALVVYALGKNPSKAKELAAIKDPVKFAFAVAKLETQLKVTPRRNVPAPESRVKGGMPITTTDAHLAKLETEAQRTGDRSKVIAYRREKARAKADA